MNWDQVKGKWKQFAGEAKQRWGRLTDDDVMVIDGSREKLIGTLQEKYGLAREECERQVDEFSEWCCATHK